ncbi:MAG: hypothetical protein Q4A23_02275 [bacterium]|nr:hypothetical protein [bacterium]
METIIRKMIELAKLVDHKESIDFIEAAEEFLDKEPIRAKENKIIYQVFLEEKLESVINLFNKLIKLMTKNQAKKARKLIRSLDNKINNKDDGDQVDKAIEEYIVPENILAFDDKKIPTIRK